MSALKSVPVTFLSVMALLVLALGWLGWVLLDQDLSLKGQRIRERVDQAAFELEEAVSHGITGRQQSLEEIAAALKVHSSSEASAAHELLSTNATLVHFFSKGITVTPETGLRYLPGSGDPKRLRTEFELTDRLEFQQQDDQAAIRLLRPLSESPDETIQASALVRIGRIERRNGRTSDALDAYGKLARLKGQRINSVPANWLALYAGCAIYHAENNLIALAAELKKLVSVLTEGGYRASASSYRYYVDAATTWAATIGQPELVDELGYPHSESEIATRFFKMWDDWRQGASDESGILIGGGSNDRVLGLWTTFGSDLLAKIFTLEDFYSTSLAGVTNKLQSQGIGWRISDATGDVLLSSSSLLENGSSSFLSGITE